MPFNLSQVSGTTVAFSPPGLSGGEASNSTVPWLYSKRYGFGVKFKYQTTPSIRVVAHATGAPVYVFVNGAGTGVNYNGTNYNDAGAGLVAGDTVEYYISSSDSAFRIFRSVNGALAAMVVDAASIVTATPGGQNQVIVARGLSSSVNTYTYPGVVDALCWDSVPQYTAPYTPGATFDDLYANRVASWQLNGNLDDTAGVVPAPATAVTASGPSTGTVGVASSPFTLGLNGTDTGTVVVTPSDGGGGGTFSPSTVNIINGAPANCTYTPGSAGVKTISFTNDRGLTNPASISLTAVSTEIPADNAAIYYSPAGWLVGSGSAKTINTGQYLRVLFTGSTCVLKFDMTGLATPYPMLLISVDGRPAQRSVLAASVTVTMPTDQNNTKHLLEVMVDSMTETQPRWSTQSTAVKLTGIALATSGDTVSAVETQPTYDIYFGDSITEGVRTLALNGTADRDRNSAAVGWVPALARILGGEFCCVGFGATGFNAGGSGGVPKLASTWASLWSGQARSFATPPRRAIIMMGTNDTASVTTEATAVLNGMLAAMAGTRIYVLRPFNGTSRAAELQAAIAACSNPGRVTYIDTAGFWASADSSDALHPYGYTNIAQIAPRIAAAIRAIEATTATGFPSTSRLGGLLQ